MTSQRKLMILLETHFYVQESHFSIVKSLDETFRHEDRRFTAQHHKAGKTSTRAMAKHILRQTNKLYLHHHLASISDFFNSIHITKFIGLVILLFYFDISYICCVLFVKFEKKSSPFFTQCQIDVLTQDVKIASFK